MAQFESLAAFPMAADGLRKRPAFRMVDFAAVGIISFVVFFVVLINFSRGAAKSKVLDCRISNWKFQASPFGADSNGGRFGG